MLQLFAPATVPKMGTMNERLILLVLLFALAGESFADNWISRNNRGFERKPIKEAEMTSESKSISTRQDSTIMFERFPKVFYGSGEDSVSSPSAQAMFIVRDDADIGFDHPEDLDRKKTTDELYNEAASRGFDVDRFPANLREPRVKFQDDYSNDPPNSPKIPRESYANSSDSENFSDPEAIRDERGPINPSTSLTLQPLRQTQDDGAIQSSRKARKTRKQSSRREKPRKTESYGIVQQVQEKQLQVNPSYGSYSPSSSYDQTPSYGQRSSSSYDQSSSGYDQGSVYGDSYEKSYADERGNVDGARKIDSKDRYDYQADLEQWANPFGIPGVDFPAFAWPPQTGFSCANQRYPGYYADPGSYCQAFYICQHDGREDAFLCPNGTLFNQQYFICDWYYNVDCSQARQFYSLNALLYQVPASKSYSKSYDNDLGSYGGSSKSYDDSEVGFDLPVPQDGGYRDDLPYPLRANGAGTNQASDGQANDRSNPGQSYAEPRVDHGKVKVTRKKGKGKSRARDQVNQSNSKGGTRPSSRDAVSWWKHEKEPSSKSGLGRGDVKSTAKTTSNQGEPSESTQDRKI